MLPAGSTDTATVESCTAMSSQFYSTSVIQHSATNVCMIVLAALMVIMLCRLPVHKWHPGYRERPHWRPAGQRD